MSLIQANGMLIEELIRNTFGALALLAFFAAIYFATRRFMGEKGKTATRGSTIFAVGALLALLTLLVTRPAHEPFVARLAAPLNSLVVSSDTHWPEQVAVGLVRMVIVTIAIVLIIQMIGRIYWYSEARLHRWHAARKGLGAHFVVFLTAALRVGRYVLVVVLVFAFLPLILNFFPRTRILVDRSEGYLATPARDVGVAILAYLPNLGYLAVILIAGFYSLKAIKYLFTSLESGSLTVRGFLPEWAIPTYRLVRTLFLLFLLMVT
jgi:hypothetical protein